MQARAESAAATRARILEAAATAMRRQFRPDIRLDAVAAEAGVSVQTVLRVFGSRRQLLDEVAEQQRQPELFFAVARRLGADPSDPGALRAIGREARPALVAALASATVQANDPRIATTVDDFYNPAIELITTMGKPVIAARCYQNNPGDMTRIAKTSPRRGNHDLFSVFGRSN